MSDRTGRREFLQSASMTAAGLVAATPSLAAAVPAMAAEPVAPKTMGARFRELLLKRTPFENIAAYDVFTSRMVELMGYPSIYLGGSLLADHHTQPVWLTSMRDRIEYFRQIAENVEIPTLADLEDGGDPVVLYRLTKRFEQARAGGIHVVDAAIGPMGRAMGVLPVD